MTIVPRTIRTAARVAVAFSAVSMAATAQEGSAARRIGSGVAAANPRTGAPETRIAAGYELRPVAQGGDLLENPSGPARLFGYLDDGPDPSVGCSVRSKTEPDEHTYLILDHNPGGPAPGYDYGRHFLYQGHERSGFRSFVTRINLDVTDPAHRITLLTPFGADGTTGLDQMDGSTWNPFSRTLLFTMEADANGGVLEVTAGWPAIARTLYGSIGRGGYEGIHPDDRGTLLLAEDHSGTKVNVVRGDPGSPRQARQPAGFMYRFVPADSSDLGAGGRLQALQVWVDGEPVVFHAADPVGDVFSDAQLALHTPGTSWPARWITVHDTAVEGDAPFDANLAARTEGATPFKRPENAQYLPGSGFNTFFFAPTGDTNLDAGSRPELAARGAWGAIFRVDLPAHAKEDGVFGSISIVVLGDREHNSFDNLAFADATTLLVAEDRGDTLHRQLNVLDSVWAYDVRRPGDPPGRFIALGRDPDSALNAACVDAGVAGFPNDGDNEPTGLHVSEGDDSVQGMQGKPPNPEKARWFVTQQHGLNVVYEIARVK